MPPTHIQKRKLLKYFVPSIDRHPDWPVIISEGDSWFSFPIHANTIDFLDEAADRRISLLRLESSGDKALRIIGGKQKTKLQRYLGRYPVNALLFSGGGNDVIGQDLMTLLHPKTGSMTWRDCINDGAVEDRMQALGSAYRDLVRIRNENRPDCRIYVHGYDYANPNGKGARMWRIKVGPWIQPTLIEKGILDPVDQRHLVRHLIDEFNDMLEVLVRDHDGVVHVKTRRTLTLDEWNDELHPTRKGFEKVAAKFQAQLEKQFPATF